MTWSRFETRTLTLRPTRYRRVRRSIGIAETTELVQATRKMSTALAKKERKEREETRDVTRFRRKEKRESVTQQRVDDRAVGQDRVEAEATGKRSG